MTHQEIRTKIDTDINGKNIMAWLLHWFDFDGLLQSIAAVSVVDQIRLHFSLGITKKTLCHTQLVNKQPHKTPDALLSMRTVYCGLLFWEVEAFSLFQCVYRRGLFWKSRSDMRKWRMSLNFVKKLALAVILPEVVQIKLLQKGFSFSKRWDHIIQSR